MHLLASAPLALQLSLVNEIFSEMVSDQMIEASLSLSLHSACSDAHIPLLRGKIKKTNKLEICLQYTHIWN